MQFALIINESQEAITTRKDPERVGPYMGAWYAYSTALAEAGVMTGGAGLQLPETAATLRLSDGKHVVQDGPFAESKEWLGGFFVIDVAGMEQALEWAARAPLSDGGAIEVRPLLSPPARS